LIIRKLGSITRNVNEIKAENIALMKLKTHKITVPFLFKMILNSCQTKGSDTILNIAKLNDLLAL